MTTVSRVVDDDPQESPSDLRAETRHRIHRGQGQVKGKLYLVIRHVNPLTESIRQISQPETSDCSEFRMESEALSYEKKHRENMALELVATLNCAK